MEFHPEIHNRKSIRLRDYDYACAGAYFVTVCTFQRECVFGEITNGGIVLNPTGMAVDECWQAIPAHFPHVDLDEFVIMPNHVHGIIFLNEPVGARHASPESRRADMQKAPDFPVGATHASPGIGQARSGPQRGSIGAIVGSFKSAGARRINTHRNTPGAPVWQRNYFERVIRDDRELDAIRQYIEDNPAKWEEDENHPSRREL